MTDIRNIKEDSDLSDRKLFGWDLVMNGKPYDVWYFQEFCHHTGSHGDERLWCCPQGEEPTYKNLVAFSGAAPTWGIVVKEGNTHKTKWYQDEIRKYVSCMITRNGEDFYDVSGNGMDFALARAQVCLAELQEHPIPFNMRNWKEELLNRKVYFRDQPAIVTTILNEGRVVLAPDGQLFRKPCWQEDDDEREDVVVDFLDRSVFWFGK